MSRTIRLVQGTVLPRVGLELFDKADSEAPVDISQATSASVHLRKVGDTDVKTTLSCSIENGVVYLDIQPAQLDIDPGLYQGEVVIDFAGQPLKLFDTLRINLRAKYL